MPKAFSTPRKLNCSLTFLNRWCHVNLLPYEAPIDMEEAIRSFVHYYNYWPYHEALRDVVPFDVYTGRDIELLQQRKEAKRKTLEARKSYNSTVREQGFGLRGVHYFQSQNVALLQTRYTRTQPPPAEGQSTYYSLEEVTSKLLDISRRKGFQGESKIGAEELEMKVAETLTPEETAL